MAEGRIIKAISGFYYVQSGEHIYPCKGRGVFRKKQITPLVGDFVSFNLDDNEEGYITEIEPRTTELVRPPIANVNQAIIVSSATMPTFSTTLLDRFLVLIEAKGIRPVIIITKIDLASDEEKQKLNQYQQDYETLGYIVKIVSSKEGSTLDQIKPLFKGKVSVIAGQSGVGKSSLLNALKPSLLLKTADISKSLGRGKHTTRHVELMEINDGLVADTPGFSALEFDDIELMNLPICFPEIRERMNQCKFRGCLHIKEPKCAVKAAVQQGEIPEFRYEHYVSFVEEIQSRKPRY